MRTGLALLVMLVGFGSMAQTAPKEPPYKRFPSLPALTILLGDSSSRYTKADFPAKKPIVLMLFSPTCDHCQHTAEEMYAKRELLKDIHIVMVTLNSISEMNAFGKNYKLDQMPNVVIGYDLYFFMVPFYDIKQFPYMAFYDDRGNLIEGVPGMVSVERIKEIVSR